MITTIATDWTEFQAVLVPGYQVASGRGNDPHFPGGTLKMQAPLFRERGLDLSPFFLGTMNVNIAPLRYRLLKPKLTLRQVKWHPADPAEDFSFFDARLQHDDGSYVQGLIYYPHPETKPRHFQDPHVLELLFPHLDDVTYGKSLRLSVKSQQISIE